MVTFVKIAAFPVSTAVEKGILKAQGNFGIKCHDG